MWVLVVGLVVLVVPAFCVSTGAGVQAFGGCPLLSWRVPSFCPLYCFALVALLANMPLFLILRGF